MAEALVGVASSAKTVCGGEWQDARFKEGEEQ